MVKTDEMVVMDATGMMVRTVKMAKMAVADPKEHKEA